MAKHRGMMAVVAIATITLLGCPELPKGDPARTRVRPADELAPAVGPSCIVDSDCALLPYVTCCGECPAAPPFDVGTREDLDAILIEMEQRCALDLRECTPPTCELIQNGCSARAACVDGHC